MDRFSLVHPPFTLVPAQPVRVVLNASRDRLNEKRELAAYESKWRRLVPPELFALSSYCTMFEPSETELPVSQQTSFIA